MVRLSAAGAALSLMSTTLAVPTRRADVLACLQDAGVPADLRGTEEWSWDGTAYNLRVPVQPAAIAVPQTIEHIVAAVKCGVQNGVPVNAKGGGHGYTSLGFGGEDGHLTIEMDRMHNVTLDKETNQARVQPGTRLGHLATELLNQGNRAISHGTCPGVGAAGHSLHGGYGMVAHGHGLALDWLIGATVVLANGTTVHCSEDENSDLFWALRGAAPSFGIVAELEYKTFEVPEQMTVFTVPIPMDKSNASQSLRDIQAYGKTMPRNMALQTYIDRTGYQLIGSFMGNETEMHAGLDPLVEKVAGWYEVAEAKNWTDYIIFHGNIGDDIDITTPAYSAHDNFYASSMVVPEISAEQFQSFADYVADVGQTIDESHDWFIQMDAIGGDTSAVSDVANDATAYPHRDKLLLFQLYDATLNINQTYPDDGYSFLKGFRTSITDTMTNGTWGIYANYADGQLTSEEAQTLYWADNLPRLRELKATYDPDNIFRSTQSVQLTSA
ncbi:FAD/FMN-containing dehydrogenase [Geosmithia morbida]|uniref:FAD/FMN-containing dehydrogenase n=1 Tax=Geosmithia morbida TaxID=1094350 RepID=A0A9P4YSG7_9HYPO|nr:FAD/FMN-containing dehydrogenase [Geosmithia morbida]KAF4121692.1 FAD/FMN-containing dehydrogenase [Geosmithia morbida]